MRPFLSLSRKLSRNFPGPTFYESLSVDAKLTRIRFNLSNFAIRFTTEPNRRPDQNSTLDFARFSIDPFSLPSVAFQSPESEEADTPSYRSFTDSLHSFRTNGSYNFCRLARRRSRVQVARTFTYRARYFRKVDSVRLTLVGVYLR